MMLTFPQLASGAGAQYPLTRSRSRRTVRNVLPDGSDVKFTDEGAGAARWDVNLRELSDAEVQAVVNLFTACEGRLRTFTFVDPGANLLAASSDVTNAVWHKDPLLQVTAGIADPTGGTRAFGLVNAGQAPQSLRQTLAAPGSFQYCFSLYARSAGAAAIRLIRSSATANQATGFALGGNWQRISSSGALGGSDPSVTFAIELVAGAAVEVFGLQVEAQVSPSAYMETGPSGLYSRARFDMDTLTAVALAPGRSDLIVKIVSPDGA